MESFTFLTKKKLVKELRKWVKASASIQTYESDKKLKLSLLALWSDKHYKLSNIFINTLEQSITEAIQEYKKGPILKWETINPKKTDGTLNPDLRKNRNNRFK